MMLSCNFPWTISAIRSIAPIAQVLSEVTLSSEI